MFLDKDIPRPKTSTFNEVLVYNLVSSFNITWKKMDLLMIHWPFLSRPWCLGFQICFTPPMFGGQCHHHQHQKKNSQTFSSYSWWFQPLLKNMSQNGFISLLGVKIKNICLKPPPSFCFNVDRFDAKLICMQPKSLEINFSMGFDSIDWERSTRISPLLPSYLRQLHWGDYWDRGSPSP